VANIKLWSSVLPFLKHLFTARWKNGGLIHLIRLGSNCGLLWMW